MSAPTNPAVQSPASDSPAVLLRPYSSEDTRAVVDLWNACEPLATDFRMDAALWHQNVDRCPATAWPACQVAYESEGAGRIIGVVVVKHPRHISAVCVHPEHQRRGIGRVLVEAAMSVIEVGEGLASGAWIAGADLCHFFPGVPVQADAAFAFFRALGFEIGADENASYDLARDLSGYVIPEAVTGTIEKLRRQGIVIAPCRTEDIPALRAHLQETFPGRWEGDTFRRIEMEPDPSEIIIARDDSAWGGEGSQVLGFAHTFSTRSKWIGPPVYWRGSLGPHYGGLGPIGLAVRARKLGLGLALLAAGVQAVKNTGATHMAIDWTNLLDFYAKVGFTPWKKYLSAWRP